MRRAISVAVVAVMIGACSSDRPATSGTTTAPVNSTVPTTAGTGTSVVPTTSPTTIPTPTIPTSTLPIKADDTCPTVGDTERKRSSDPLLMTGAIGVDIRTGRHPCFERLVIEAKNGSFPGWTVEYVDDPVQLSPSDLTVFIKGDATLQVRMSMWMPTMEGDGYPGPIRVLPTNVNHILEMHETENFEGMCIWSIGLDKEYPFTVNLLRNPERLVIDFQIPPES